MIFVAAARLVAVSLAAFTPLLADAFVVRSPTCTTASALVHQTRFGRASPPFVLSDMIESSEESQPELVVQEEEKEEEQEAIASSEDSTAELAVEEEQAEEVIESSEDSAPEFEEEEAEIEEAAASSSEESSPKRVVTRERHTAFVGNLPFGRF